MRFLVLYFLACLLMLLLIFLNICWMMIFSFIYVFTALILIFFNILSCGVLEIDWDDIYDFYKPIFLFIYRYMKKLVYLMKQ